MQCGWTRVQEWLQGHQLDRALLRLALGDFSSRKTCLAVELASHDGGMGEAGIWA